MRSHGRHYLDMLDGFARASVWPSLLLPETGTPILPEGPLMELLRSDSAYNQGPGGQSCESGSGDVALGDKTRR